MQVRAKYTFTEDWEAENLEQAEQEAVAFARELGTDYLVSVEVVSVEEVKDDGRQAAEHQTEVSEGGG